MTEAVGYLRVSGKGQLAGDGFTRQREEIERFAAAEGYAITAWYEERGVTGKTDWDDRDAWVEMVASEPKVIIVEGLDRLAREFAVQEIFLRTLRKRGITFLSTREPDIENEADPTRKLIRGVIGLLAEYERSMIERKLRVARERMRARDGRCEGRKPYGHRPGETPWLEAILAAHSRGMSTRAIAEWLNSQGAPVRSKGVWRHGTVGKIIAGARRSAIPQAAESVPRSAVLVLPGPSASLSAQETFPD